MQTCEKKLKRVFCLSCFGFCLDEFRGLGFPGSGQRRDTWYPLGVYPKYPLAIPHCEFREDSVGASSPYLGEMMMTDEKLFQMFMFA